MPAVTRVDEWTRALTGVGAAIAAGSQAEKGSWALLVKLARRIRVTRVLSWIKELRWVKLQDPTLAKMAIEIRIALSPSRFLKAVKRPALLEESLLK